MKTLAELLCRDRCCSDKIKYLQSCFALADAVVADGMKYLQSCVAVTDAVEVE